MNRLLESERMTYDEVPSAVMEKIKELRHSDAFDHLYNVSTMMMMMESAFVYCHKQTGAKTRTIPR